MSKFLRDVVDEIWYNDLNNANNFYTKVKAIDIMALLDTNNGGLHALDMNGIPQFIVMMEDAQNEAMRASMPIANIELVKMALAAVLAAQHFPHKVDD
jgi:hypothetical protein